jgi:hypothetical protein
LSEFVRRAQEAGVTALCREPERVATAHLAFATGLAVYVAGT